MSGYYLYYFWIQPANLPWFEKVFESFQMEKVMLELPVICHPVYLFIEDESRNKYSCEYYHGTL